MRKGTVANYKAGVDLSYVTSTPPEVINTSSNKIEAAFFIRADVQNIYTKV